MLAILCLLKELAGQSNDQSKYVYLSDGGHFDNLGVYEMLRRRCKQIVVFDVGEDRAYGYFDLSHALQRANIDMNTEVEFHPSITVGTRTLPGCGMVAKITYPASKDKLEQSGKLFYLKPWLPLDAPVQVTAFQNVRQAFPHDTTADQFFTESDFESYRFLGEYLTKTALNKACASDGGLRLDEMFNGLDALADAPPEEHGEQQNAGAAMELWITDFGA